jgi:hypothetical protein
MALQMHSSVLDGSNVLCLKFQRSVGYKLKELSQIHKDYHNRINCCRCEA